MSLLEARDLTFGYGEREVLTGVSVSAERGEIVALLGPNGCGKSTLLRLLLGQLRGRGRVVWDGRELADWTPRQLARFAAYLPQQPVFPAGIRVGDAIAMGRYPHLGLLGLESQRDVAVVREAAGLMDLSEHLRRPVAELSGGQRQRVFVARCLAQEPTAMLLDEPDTFLDLQHVAQLATLLRDLSRHRAGRPRMGVILATHNLHLAAAVSDRVLLMSQGKVAASGPPAEVITPERIQDVYGVRAVRWSAEGQWGLGVVY